METPGENLTRWFFFQQAGSCLKPAPSSNAAKAFDNMEYLNVAIAPLI